MKKLLLIAGLFTALCFAFTKPVAPPTFKQDMEAFMDILNSSMAQLENGADSISIANTLKAAADDIDSRWTVDIEMENAESLWPGDACRYHCGSNFLQCIRHKSNFLAIIYCGHVYIDCLRCCKHTNIPCN